MNMNFDLTDTEISVINEIKPLLKQDTELYLVGGYIRDKILDKENFDMDFIVKGENAIELAQKFADTTNRYFVILDEKYEIARVIAQDKIHYYDFARCENDDITRDILRRDLSINAIAMQVFPENLVIDITNGLNDIKNQKIQVISEKNLIDDPLRLLRIFRFASCLDFSIAEKTLKFAKEHVALINNVAKERVLAELFKFFEGKNSANYIKLMRNNGLLYQIFEILKLEEKIPPNTHHHLCLIEHSIETVNQIEKIIHQMPLYLQEKVQSYQTNGIKYISLLKIAALLHDVGKYQTWTIEENGRHRFINHDSVGAELLIPILKEMKFSKSQIKYVTTLVKNHIYPSQLAKMNEEANEKAIYRMFRKLENYTPDILLLAIADRLSAQGPAITKEITENNINSLLKYMSMYEEFLKNQKPIEKLLDGNEIAKILNISKDKNLGIIINKLQEAQLNQEVTSKNEAIEFIKKIKI